MDRLETAGAQALQLFAEPHLLVAGLAAQHAGHRMLRRF
jgi:hypothetical protein